MDSQDLKRFINEESVEAEIVFLEEHTPTVADAAAAVDVHPDQIVKSILFLADKEPVLVVANGLTRVDYKRLADYLGTSRRRVKSASAKAVLDITGYQAGAVPPFGHKRRLRTILDEDVLAQSFVYGGGGEVNALMRLTVPELQRISGEEVAALAKRENPPATIS